MSKVALLGLAGGAAYLYSKHRRARPSGTSDEPDAIPDSFAADPQDAVQSFDDIYPLHVEELGVEAMTEADVEGDLELAETETFLEDEGEQEPELAGDRVENLDDIERRAHDVGDLYGIHTPHATDRDHPDDDHAFAEGQNWMEALETDAAEGGPAPEEGIEDVVDDEDVYDPPHASDTRDRPVADRGSGGPGGI
jgi:hypothetical protein